MFPGSLERTRDALAADPSGARWGPRLFLVEDTKPTLAGWGGFKGAPDAAGAVEIGYAIAPACEGRGIATAAVGALLAQAWDASEVRCVVAHTLPARNASVRVLEKAGFARDGAHLDGDVGEVWRFRLDRERRGGARTSQQAIG